jgi:hypothetical protein
MPCSLVEGYGRFEENTASVFSIEYVRVLVSPRLFLFTAQTKEFFLDGLKRLEQRSHKCVELRGEYVE